MSKVVVGFDKKPIMQEDKKLTFGNVIATTLATPLEEDKGLVPTKVLHRMKLAQQAYEGGEVELEAADAAEIQKRLAQTHILVVAGQVIEALNG